MIFNKNAIWVGLLVGLVVPFVGYAVLLTIFEEIEAMGWISQEGFSPFFRQRTLGIIAICLNLIPFNIYKRRNFMESLRGVIFPTIFYVIVWLVYFGSYIL